MRNDAIKVRSEFDRSFSGIIERSEAIPQLPERPVIFVSLPSRGGLRQKRRLEFTKLSKKDLKIRKEVIITNYTEWNQ